MKLIAAILFILCVVLVMPSMVMAVLASAAATRKERWQLRGMIAVTILILTALFYTAVHAAESVQPTLEVTKLTVEITWVESAAELSAIREQYVRRQGDMRSAASIGTAESARGFSLLVRRGDELICRLWVFRPVRVDDDGTTALGHELLHCALGRYHR